MKMKIRKISPRDRNDIEEIARGTWEGEDYLANIFDKWIKEGGFFGIEENEKIIATGKITIFPEKVGWLEGLRVHPDYRGKGYGRKMHEFLLQRTQELKKKGIIQTLEYATYIYNETSINLGLRTGFRIVKRYYAMDYESRNTVKPEESYLESIEEFEYRDYIPCGWKFFHKTTEAIEYIQKMCHIFSYKGYKFLVLKEHPEEVTPFTLDPLILKTILPALSYFSPDKEISIRIPEELDYGIYESLGFKKWENVVEPEILLLRNEL